MPTKSATNPTSVKKKSAPKTKRSTETTKDRKPTSIEPAPKKKASGKTVVTAPPKAKANPKTSSKGTAKPGGAKKVAKKKGGKKNKKTKISLSPWIALALVVAAFLGPYIYYNLTGHIGSYFGTHVPSEVRNMKFVVDISHHNDGKILWDSLYVMIESNGKTTDDFQKADKIQKLQYVIMKASEGESMKDVCFDDFWTKSGRSGLKRGAYHFFRSSKDPTVQAQNFISAVGPLMDRDLPPILDIETIHKGCSMQTLNENALTWLRIVEDYYGRRPIVYTSDSFLRDNLSYEIKEKYPLWIARYNNAFPKHGDWMMWQFTDKATVKGFAGKVDLSVMR